MNRTLYDRDYGIISDYYLEASRGTINDVSVVHKFGLAESIDTADGQVDIWDGCAADIGGKITDYNWIDSPVYLQVSSSDDADAGVTFSVQGLDQDWNLITVEITCGGTSGVTIPGVQWRRVFRAYNSGSVDMTGSLFISDNGSALVGGIPTDTTTVRAIVHAHGQQTQMALYTVPAGYDMFITHGWANISKATTAEALVEIYRRAENGVFRIVHTFALQTSGSSGDHRPYQIPLKFSEKEDIIYRATVYTNGVAISAGFHALLIGNSNFP